MTAHFAQVASIITEIRKNHNVKPGDAHFDSIASREITHISATTQKFFLTPENQKIIVRSAYLKHNIDLQDKAMMGTVQMMMVLLTRFKYMQEEVAMGTSNIVTGRSDDPAKKAPSINISKLGAAEKDASLFTGINVPPSYRGTIGLGLGPGTALMEYRNAATKKYRDRWEVVCKKQLVNVEHRASILKFIQGVEPANMVYMWSMLGDLQHLGRLKQNMRAALPPAFYMMMFFEHCLPASWGPNYNCISGATGVGYGWEPQVTTRLALQSILPDKLKYLTFSGAGFYWTLYQNRQIELTANFEGDIETIRQWMFLSMFNCQYEDLGVLKAMTGGITFKQRDALQKIKKSPTCYDVQRRRQIEPVRSSLGVCWPGGDSR